jgi:hypothetical protein
MVTGYLYILIGLAIESQARENLGLGLLSLVTFTFLFNITCLVKKYLLRIYEWVKDKLKKYNEGK